MKQLLIIIGLFLAICGFTVSCGSEEPKVNLNPVQVGRTFLNDRGIDAGYQKSIDLHAQEGILTYKGDKYAIAFCDNVPDTIAFAVNQKNGTFRIAQKMKDGRIDMLDPEQWWAAQGVYLMTDQKHCIANGSLYVSEGPSLTWENGWYKVHMKIRNISGRDINLTRISMTILSRDEVHLKNLELWGKNIPAGAEAIIEDTNFIDYPLAGHIPNHLGNINTTIDFSN